MKRNFWPLGIVIYFIIFISAIVSWVIFATRHQDQLIRSDYYNHEILYQEQIGRATRAATLNIDRVLMFDENAGVLRVQLAPEFGLTGKVQLYRPSDATLDREIQLRLNENGTARFDLSDLKGGLWKVLMSWNMSGQEYYLEKTILARNH